MTDIEQEAASAFLDAYHEREGMWDELGEDDPDGLQPRTNTLRGIRAAFKVLASASPARCEHGIALGDLCDYAEHVANGPTSPALPDHFAPKPVPGTVEGSLSASPARETVAKELVDAATYALCDYDTDLADRGGPTDAHWEERRGDVLRVLGALGLAEQSEPAAAQVADAEDS